MIVIFIVVVLLLENCIFVSFEGVMCVSFFVNMVVGMFVCLSVVVCVICWSWLIMVWLIRG